MLYTLNYIVLYVNYISIKPKEKTQEILHKKIKWAVEKKNLGRHGEAGSWVRLFHQWGGMEATVETEMASL